MKAWLKQWAENFQDEVASIEIEFAAYFEGGQLKDYYTLDIDEESNSLSITVKATEEIPNHISESLKNAVNNSKPKQA